MKCVLLVGVLVMLAGCDRWGKTIVEIELNQGISPGRRIPVDTTALGEKSGVIEIQSREDHGFTLRQRVLVPKYVKVVLVPYDKNAGVEPPPMHEVRGE